MVRDFYQRIFKIIRKSTKGNGLMSIILSENHPCMQYSSDIRQVCAPLIDTFKLTYFNYVKLTNENGRIILTNRPDWVIEYYKNSFYLTNYAIEIESILSEKFITWERFKEMQPFQLARERFNIVDGATLIIPGSDCIEIFYFGIGSNNSHLMHIDLSKFDAFMRFVFYFKERCYDIINGLSNSIIYDKNRNIDFSGLSKNNKPLEEDGFILLNNPEQYRFAYKDINNETVCMTTRESLCAAYLILQLSSTRIGERLGISKRTVEDYISNIKEKLNTYSKQSLIDKLIELPIVNKDDPNTSLGKFFKNKNILVTEDSIKNYIDQTPIKRLYLDRISKGFYMTKKERECLFYLSIGLSAKAIASRIDCSVRTTEEYLNKIKIKFRVSRKSDLVDLCFRLNIFDKLRISLLN